MSALVFSNIEAEKKALAEYVVLRSIIFLCVHTVFTHVKGKEAVNVLKVTGSEVSSSQVKSFSHCIV